MFLNFLSCKKVTRFSNNLRIICQSQVKNVKCTEPTLYKSFHCTQNNAFKITNIRKINEKSNTDISKIIASIQNNVILYKNENIHDFSVLKLIFFGFVCLNATLSFVTYTSKHLTTWSTRKSWLKYIEENASSLVYIAYSTIIGPITIALLYALNTRIIRYIILHKGGTQISLITNHLYKKNNTLTVLVDEVKVTISRSNMKNYLPLKIHNRKFYYLVDGHGQFFNQILFDYTLGTQKKW